jgi:hypothetical protein
VGRITVRVGQIDEGHFASKLGGVPTVKSLDESIATARFDGQRNVIQVKGVKAGKTIVTVEGETSRFNPGLNTDLIANEHFRHRYLVSVRSGTTSEMEELFHESQSLTQFAIVRHESKPRPFSIVSEPVAEIALMRGANASLASAWANPSSLEGAYDGLQKGRITSTDFTRSAFDAARASVTVLWRLDLEETSRRLQALSTEWDRATQAADRELSNAGPENQERTKALLRQRLASVRESLERKHEAIASDLSTRRRLEEREAQRWLVRARTMRLNEQVSKMQDFQLGQFEFELAGKRASLARQLGRWPVPVRSVLDSFLSGDLDWYGGRFPTLSLESPRMMALLPEAKVLDVGSVFHSNAGRTQAGPESPTRSESPSPSEPAAPAGGEDVGLPLPARPGSGNSSEGSDEGLPRPGKPATEAPPSVASSSEVAKAGAESAAPSVSDDDDRATLQLRRELALERSLEDSAADEEMPSRGPVTLSTAPALPEKTAEPPRPLTEADHDRIRFIDAQRAEALAGEAAARAAGETGEADRYANRAREYGDMKAGYQRLGARLLDAIDDLQHLDSELKEAVDAGDDTNILHCALFGLRLLTEALDRCSFDNVRGTAAYLARLHGKWLADSQVRRGMGPEWVASSELTQRLLEGVATEEVDFKKVGEVLGLSDKLPDQYGRVASLQRMRREQQKIIDLIRSNGGTHAADLYKQEEGEKLYYGGALGLVAGGSAGATESTGTGLHTEAFEGPRPPRRAALEPAETVGNPNELSTPPTESSAAPGKSVRSTEPLKGVSKTGSGTERTPPPSRPAETVQVNRSRPFTDPETGVTITHSIDGQEITVHFTVGERIARGGMERFIDSVQDRHRMHAAPPNLGVEDPAGLAPGSKRANLSADPRIDNFARGLYEVRPEGTDLNVQVSVRRDPVTRHLQAKTYRFEYAPAGQPNGSGTHLATIGYEMRPDGTVNPLVLDAGALGAGMIR